MDGEGPAKLAKSADLLSSPIFYACQPVLQLLFPSDNGIDHVKLELNREDCEIVNELVGPNGSSS